MNQILSLDWGTSRFRLRLIETPGLVIRAASISQEGIADTHNSWLQANLSDDDRLFFYQSIILSHIQQLSQQQGTPLAGIPLIISGMASSSIGMLELPYKESPFALDGSDLYIKGFKATPSFDHPMWIISGTRTGLDVMRGEETLLAGASLPEWEEQIVVIPGTHSKHVLIRNRFCRDFDTYMTGEFFEILSAKSTLSASITAAGNFKETGGQQMFIKGLLESLDGNLLRNSFRVRTHELFKKHTAADNYFYLSGLLIGEECKQLVNSNIPITMITGTQHRGYYELALRILQIASNVEVLDADECLVKGQWKVYNGIISNE